MMLAVLLGLTLTASASPPSEPKPRPSLSCKVGNLELEGVRGWAGVRAAVAQSVLQNDPAALGFLKERLTELIDQDSSRALDVLGWMDELTEPELALYMGALREAEAVRHPPVASRLLALAEPLQSPTRKARILEALETQHRFEPEALERLTALARQDPSAPGVAMHAVRTIGRVMENDFRRTGHFEPYMARLLELASASADPHLRSLAVEMGTGPSVRWDGASVEGLARLMRQDPSPGVREMAALALSSGRDTQAVLEHFRAAFPAEKERCVRWALVRYAVRAGGPLALPLLREFARMDRRFQPDSDEFKALYDAGHVDFDRLWPDKKVRHPSCEVSEG